MGYESVCYAGRVSASLSQRDPRENILGKNTLIPFPKHKLTTLLFNKTAIPSSHTLHNVETHSKRLSTHSILQTTHVPFAHDKEPYQPFNCLSYLSPSSFPSLPSTHHAPHRGQAQVNHQASFLSRFSPRQLLRIQRERGIDVVDKDRRHCHGLRTLARLISQTNNIQKSTSPSSLLGFGAATVPHPTTSPHTTTSIVQTTTHPFLHPTFRTPLVTSRSSTQLTFLITSPGTCSWQRCASNTVIRVACVVHN